MRIILLVFVLAMSVARASAQDVTATVRGVIVDARDGSPLRDVSVRLQGGKTTVTGDDGRFELTEVPAGTRELYVSVVDYMLVKRTIVVPGGGELELTIPVAPGTGTYAESVTVRSGNEFAPATPAVSEQTLPNSELQQLRGLITNDPFRAVQVLPGVAAGDDLRSEFTVRGYAVDHMNFTFEGVPAPFLVHTVQGIHDSGSIAMVNGDILDDIVLSTGSYPQHFGGRTGAELDFHMREGSRDRVQSHVGVSFTDAAAVVEGPLGRGRKGSWLMSVRKSYLDRLIRRLDPSNDFAFGFSDVQAKLVYDLTSRHQVQFALTAGKSRLDRQPDDLDADDVKDGINTTAIGVLTWRYLASPKLIVTQKVSTTTNTFDNSTKSGSRLGEGRAAEALYRADWSYAAGSRLALSGGAQVGRSSVSRRGKQYRPGTQLDIVEDFSAAAVSESAFVEARLPAGSATVTAGVRLDHWALTHDTRASPWLQVSWPVTRALTLRAGGGIYRQEAGFVETRGTRGTPDLAPEHAGQFDAAIEGRFGAGMKWQVSGYNREDSDLIRLPNAEYKVSGGRLVAPSATARYQNALNGYSRGVELLVQRRASNGLSGWLSYSFSHTKYHDRLNGERFWGDWDQRHTVNAYASYRFSPKYSASTRFRYGSNFPTTGYWETRNGQYFVGTERNTLPVPPYSRLDMRVNRAFTWEQKRLTLYVEVINVYNRENVRYASAGINGRTFEAFGLFDTMFPRIPSVGFLLEF
ncbi:MAG TPA: carboxypeptidase regulatory-like domain-containing protein [Vicinamibacterales bacterium]|nr:carboxypeptidase regulatory-like domain-containing protein [Vicinamibacterales bacterium]